MQRDFQWISPKQIIQYAPGMSIREARRIAKTIQQRMIDDGRYIIKSKQILVPRKMVEEFLSIR